MQIVYFHQTPIRNYLSFRPRCSTAGNNGKRICHLCMVTMVASSDIISQLGKISFDDSDAKFKCPMSTGSCGATNLSYIEYWVGSCCENAAKDVPGKCKFFYVRMCYGNIVHGL